MSKLTHSFDPINIIKNSTTAKDKIFNEEFITVIQKCYNYAILKPFLDITTTICNLGRLRFEIYPRDFYMLDEGNCRTFQSFGSGKKKYIITIRKITADVIIHEIGHMLEKEAEIILDNSFNQALYSDIKNADTVPNKSLQSAIKDVMVDQVRGYPQSQRGAELFTRFFQLLAMSKEIAGFTADYGYKITDFYSAFPEMSDWLVDECYPKFNKLVDPSIANASERYVIPIDQIKHKWSGEKIKSFHGASGKEKSWKR